MLPDDDTRETEEIETETEETEAVEAEATGGAPSTEPPPLDDAPVVVEEPAAEPPPAPPPPRDHYVVGHVEGREVPIWDSLHDRQELTREEAEDSARRYTARMREAGCHNLIRYEVRGIEEHHLKTDPPAPAAPEPAEPPHVVAEVAVAEGADLSAADDGSGGAVPLPPQRIDPLSFMRRISGAGDGGER
jgi:hypothetical protein